MVPVTGLEPVRCRQRWILSPLRLPIPSHRHITICIIQECGKVCKCFMKIFQKKHPDNAVWMYRLKICVIVCPRIHQLDGLVDKQSDGCNKRKNDETAVLFEKVRKSSAD